MVVAEIAGQDFNAEVLQSDLPVFTCFTTSKCSSCFPACMVANSLAEEYDQRVKFTKCDVEKCTEVAERYGIGVLPTIVIFQNSEIVRKLVGFQERHSLKRLLETCVKG